MGIKGLSTYLKHNVTRSAREVALSDLSGLRVAVDASIYMYRGKGQEELVGSIYAMASTLRFHGVELTFVFDGVPPDEKKRTLAGRRARKGAAREELARIESDVSAARPPAIAARISRLRRDCATVTDDDVKSVKSLLTQMGVKHVDATGEAELLCAQLERAGAVDACMSDDTDVFAYGCERVIRYVSVMGRSAVLYETRGVIAEMGVNPSDFRDVCAAAGTDYSACNRGFPAAMRLYHAWRHDGSAPDFHSWIESTDSEDLQAVSAMYDLAAHGDDIPVIKTPLENPAGLRDLLGDHGFLFA